MPATREFLVDHPSQVWLFGFRLEYDENSVYGFDVERSVPTSRHMTRILRHSDNQIYQFLLDSTVSLIGEALPDHIDFAKAVSGDTKDIIAWVKENNPKQRVS